MFSTDLLRSSRDPTGISAPSGERARRRRAAAVRPRKDVRKAGGKDARGLRGDQRNIRGVQSASRGEAGEHRVGGGLVVSSTVSARLILETCGKGG